MSQPEMLAYDQEVARNPPPAQTDAVINHVNAVLAGEAEPSRQNSNTLWGFKKDQAVSAAQKAMRRGWTADCLQFVVELAAGRGWHLSNTWNRFAVWALEDIGPANPHAILEVIHLTDTTFRSLEEKATPSQGDRHWDSIIYLAISLAQSKKSRVNDWLAAIFPATHYADFPAAMGYTAVDYRQFLQQSMEERSALDCVGWCNCLHFSKEKIQSSTLQALSGRRFTTAAAYIVDVFAGMPGLGGTPYYRQLERLIFNWGWKGEVRLIYTHIINLWCAPADGGKYQWDLVAELKVRSNLLDQPDVANIIQVGDDFLEGDDGYKERGPTMGVPDYALDAHTSEGAARNRGMDHFVEHGALLNNADPWWEIPSNYLRDIFIDEVLNGKVDYGFGLVEVDQHGRHVIIPE